MKSFQIKRILFSGLICGIILAGCTLSKSEEDDAALDEQLVQVLTKKGERTLANFILPESDDFASIPQDPANPLSRDKVELGKLLFHETALATNPKHESGRGTYACATCHHAAAGFQAGRQQAISDGGSGWGKKGEGRTRNASYEVEDLDIQPIRSPTILNTAYQRITKWDGAFGAHGLNEGTEEHWLSGTDAEMNRLGYDGLETQAIIGLTAHRMGNIESSIVASHPTYTELWNRAFPGEPVSIEKAGLAIAAYERTVFANQAPFQRWLKGESSAMSPDEKRGALVFFGDTGCERMCHTGGPLNSVNYYALGVADMEGPEVYGDIPETLGRGGFLQDPEYYYMFKIPQLYNLKDSPYYGHGGMFRSIREVVEYYNEAVPARILPEGRIKRTFRPLEMTETEMDNLVLFLTESLYDPDLKRYVPDSLPSGNCIPANDPVARVDLGCD